MKNYFELPIVLNWDSTRVVGRIYLDEKRFKVSFVYEKIKEMFFKDALTLVPG